MVISFLNILNCKIKTKQYTFIFLKNPQTLIFIKKLIEFKIILNIQNISKNSIKITLNPMLGYFRNLKILNFLKKFKNYPYSYYMLKQLNKKNFIMFLFTTYGILDLNQCLRLKCGGVPICIIQL